MPVFGDTYDAPFAYDEDAAYDGEFPPPGLAFICPTDDIVGPVYYGPGLGPQNDDYYPIDPLMHNLFRHYIRQTRARNVFLMSDGTVLDSQVNGTPPNMIQPPTDPYAVVFDATSGSLVVTDFFQTPYVVRTLYGGSENPISQAEADQLTAAGYGSGIVS